MYKTNSKEINIGEIIKPYLLKWWWFLLSIFIMLVLAVLYIKSVAPVYNLQSSVLIKDAKKMSSASGDFGVLQSLGGLSSMGTNSIENEIEIFKSKKIVGDVLRKQNLQTSLYIKKGLYNLELYGKSAPIKINIVNEKEVDKGPEKPIKIRIKGDSFFLSSDEWDNEIKGQYNHTVSLPFANIIITKNKDFKATSLKKLDQNNLSFTYSTFEATIDNYQEALKVDLVEREATVISLAIASENTEKGKEFLNNIVGEYNLDAINDKNRESVNTTKFIDDRIVIISKELGDVENKKENYKSQNNIVDLQTEARINLQTKEVTKSKLLTLGTQLELQNILLNYVNKKENKDVLPVNIGIENGDAAKSILDYNMLVVRRNQLLQNATSDNPMVKEVDAQIQAMKSSIRESLSKSITAVSLAKNAAESELDKSEVKIGSIPSQEKVFRNIERQQQLKESLYLLLLQKREEAAISMAITVEKARVVDAAYVAKQLVAPQKKIILLIAVLIGLLLPAVYIYLKTLLNNTITNKDDVAKLSSTKVLVELPHLNRNDNDTVQANDLSPLAEAFRILITNFKFLLPKKESAKIVYVTSTVKGEGKTFVSVNLALTLATPNQRVLLIGADIRNPQLQRYNIEKKNAQGLTDFLYNPDIDLKEIMHQSKRNNNCDVIFSGTIPPNPTELLSNGNFKKLLDVFEDQYEYIIVDTAPIMLVTDTLLYSEYSDIVLYVLRSEVSQKEFVNFSNNLIEDQKIKNVGFVINDVSAENFGYGNKYGYGYHATEKNWFQKLISKLF
ncbi:polysaccharide biosynthesis tyrosine autokinase [Chryseobacterium sp. RG1]|uniref:non-specific protein-tyrosine kinase n=1 Tax=Chryseobacterium tagetis TaxID=2801334 RepID=A0ABS8A573_9FLAO|nr:polysaccharide biosynthesis tyrosine autokinase [Chryseobacterium tagetis]MCA6069127.1 polysaccharide biosynthesis tyrosine autokinase [Chryseobacterium tagetis]